MCLPNIELYIDSCGFATEVSGSAYIYGRVYVWCMCCVCVHVCLHSCVFELGACVEVLIGWLLELCMLATSKIISG